MKKSERIWWMIAGAFGCGLAILGIWQLLVVFMLVAAIATLIISFLAGTEINFF